MEPNPTQPTEPTPETPIEPMTPTTPETPVTSDTTAQAEPFETIGVTDVPTAAESPTELSAVEAESTPEESTTPATEPAPTPIAAEVTTVPVATNPGHGLGIASLVLSILGISIVSLILGIIGLNKSKKAGQTNGLALAGIIISSIGLIVGLIFTIFYITVVLAVA